MSTYGEVHGLSVLGPVPWNSQISESSAGAQADVRVTLRIGLFEIGVVPVRGDSTWLSKIPLLPNAHPLQVNPRIGLLCTFERFSFVSGFSFPNKELMLSRPTVSSRTGYSFDITADDFNHFPVGHVVVDAPWDYW
jgi:hypothetical protein